MNSLYGYLNSQFIKKAKYSEADLNYGNFGIELSEQMLEIGELALETWKKFMTGRPTLPLFGNSLSHVTMYFGSYFIGEKSIYVQSP